jgi:hypothetical protein
MAGTPKLQRQVFPTLQGVRFVKPADIITNREKAKKHLIINNPEVAQLMEDCEKAEDLRQTRLEIDALVNGIAQITGEIELSVKKTDANASPNKPKPAITPQGIKRTETPIAEQMISDARQTDYLRAEPMSDDEINREFGQQTTQEVQPVTREEHLLAAEKLSKNYSLNRVERAFCAGLVMWLKKLPPEERQKELLKLEPRLRAMLVLFTAEEIQGGIEHQKATQIQEKMRDECRDVIIIGRKFLCAVVCP